MQIDCLEYFVCEMTYDTSNGTLISVLTYTHATVHLLCVAQARFCVLRGPQIKQL